MFWVLALGQSDWKIEIESLWRMANTWNISFFTLYGGSVVNTKFEVAVSIWKMGSNPGELDSVQFSWLFKLTEFKVVDFGISTLNYNWISVLQMSVNWQIFDFPIFSWTHHWSDPRWYRGCKDEWWLQINLYSHRNSHSRCEMDQEWRERPSWTGEDLIGYQTSHLPLTLDHLWLGWWYITLRKRLCDYG